MILSKTDLKQWERPPGKLVFTNGCFDILHSGHLSYLQEARALGDALFVGINSDNSVKALKGEVRPIQSQDNRAALLLGLSCVDYVAVFDEPTPIELIKSIGPDVLVKGGDWPIKDIVGADYVISKGGSAQSLNFVEGQSTTNIIQKILQSYR